jgi:hypothetical protein
VTELEKQVEELTKALEKEREMFKTYLNKKNSAPTMSPTPRSTGELIVCDIISDDDLPG